MIFHFDLKTFPIVKSLTKVKRNTTWEIVAEYNMLFFIHKGACRFTSNNVTDTVNEGEIYFVPAGTHYKRQSLNSRMCTITCVCFETNDPFLQIDKRDAALLITDKKNTVNEAILSGKFETALFNTLYLQSKMSPPDFDIVIKRINDINLSSTTQSLMSSLHLSNVLSDILISLSQLTIDNISANLSIDDDIKMPVILKRALSYIFKNYSAPLSLERIAEHCGISKQHMIRYFKKHLNTTPTKYIIEFKVMKAKEILFNQPHIKIKDIANMVGFEDHLYFSRVFKKIAKVSPREFRYNSINFPNPPLD